MHHNSALPHPSSMQNRNETSNNSLRVNSPRPPADKSDWDDDGQVGGVAGA